MEQLELHGQLAWVNILAAKGVNISAGGFAVLNPCWEDHFASSTTGLVRLLCGGFAVLNMCWEDHFASSTTGLVRLLCEFGQTALKLAPIFC